MKPSLEELSWPLHSVAEAMRAVARDTGLSTETEVPRAPPAIPAPTPDGRSLWIEGAGRAMGFEAEPVQAPCAGLVEMIAAAGPALIQLPGQSIRFLALSRGRGRKARLIGPGELRASVDVRVIAHALLDSIEAPLRKELRGWIEEARADPRAIEGLLQQRLAGERLFGFWILRARAGSAFPGQLVRSGVRRRLLLLLFAHLFQYLLLLGSWWLIGRGALDGRVDAGFLQGWMLLLASLIPFELASTWLAGRLAYEAGALLKLRTLDGALKLTTEETRGQGIGQFLSRVLESEAVESIGVSHGAMALTAGVDLLLSGWVLQQGAGGALHAAALFAWVCLAAWLAARFVRARGSWTARRLQLTHNLVEQMVGHRTRLAQESPASRHEAEDAALDEYSALSAAVDGREVALLSLVPRGWMVLGVLMLAPAFIFRSRGPAALAISLGGVLLAFQAMQKLAHGLAALGSAALSWRAVAPLFESSSREERPGVPATAYGAREPATLGSALLEARGLSFQHQGRAARALDRVDLSLRVGDRVLFQGPSGSGKSTLAALLVGLRVPQSGLLLVDGFDRQVLGADGWRQRVVGAPQFHENHILSHSLAFNQLLGRQWPPTPLDMAEAEAVCRELGLGPLVCRMPAGLHQIVGDTGWQLSHGEKSRVYIARALLQNADLVVLDESFGALDPETLDIALGTVLSRARTLVVISHL